MTDVPRVSREQLEKLIEWCEPRPNVVQGVKQPPNSWANLTSCLRELLAMRTPAQEAGDVVDLIRTYGNASWCEGAGQTNDAGSADELEARLIAIVRSSPAASPVTVGEHLRSVIQAVLHNANRAKTDREARETLTNVYAMLQLAITKQPAEPVCDETPISFRDEMDARQT
jgi:hypothetical protein